MKGVLSNEQLARIVGNIEGKLEIVANAHGISSIVLAQRVAELLHPEGQRTPNTVSSVSENPTGSHQGKRSTVEVGKRTSNSATRDTGVKGPAGYWASMTAEERSAEVKRRAKVAAAKGHKTLHSLAAKTSKAKRKMSPEALKNMRAAQTKRWEIIRSRKNDNPETTENMDQSPA